MKDVKKTLGLAFAKLHALAGEYDLKAESLPQEIIENLCSDIKEIEETIHEAALRAAGYVTVTLYAIGQETEVAQYSGFTNGPVPQRELMHGADGLVDGDCLVRIITKGEVTNYVTESIWMDGKWEDTGDELKIAGVSA